MNEREPQLIIFGGTFDPPHDGHVACLTLARRRFPRAKFIVYPTYAPLQDAVSVPKTPLFSFVDRLRLATAVFAGEGVEISELEKEMPCPNLSINLLLAIKEKFGNDTKLGMLIGQDQFVSFKDWQRADEMLALADLVIARRTGVLSLARIVRELATQLGVRGVWQEGEQKYVLEKSCVYLLADEVCDVSSTEVREKLLRGERVSPVPEVVQMFLANDAGGKIER